MSNKKSLKSNPYQYLLILINNLNYKKVFEIKFCIFINTYYKNGILPYYLQFFIVIIKIYKLKVKI
jgi:hypothetical protein